MAFYWITPTHQHLPCTGRPQTAQSPAVQLRNPSSLFLGLLATVLLIQSSMQLSWPQGHTASYLPGCPGPLLQSCCPARCLPACVPFQMQDFPWSSGTSPHYHDLPDTESSLPTTSATVWSYGFWLSPIKTKAKVALSTSAFFMLLLLGALHCQNTSQLRVIDTYISVMFFVFKEKVILQISRWSKTSKNNMLIW